MHEYRGKGSWVLGCHCVGCAKARNETGGFLGALADRLSGGVSTQSGAEMKYVPVDATDAMIAAALAVDWTGEDEAGVAHNVWHAMVAAAPKAAKAVSRNTTGGDHG